MKSQDKIYLELLELYKNQGIFVNLYNKIRWKLTVFEELEGFVPKEGRIIDIGCGTGLLANYLALTGPEREVIGFDISKRRIEIAEKSVGKNLKNVKFYLGDVRDFNYGKFDCIIMTDFLHHISYELQESLLKRIKNLLKNGSLTIIQEIDLKPTSKFLFAKFIDIIKNPHNKNYYRSVKNFKSLFESIGFEVRVVYPKKVLPLSNLIYICKLIDFE